MTFCCGANITAMASVYNHLAYLPTARRQLSAYRSDQRNPCPLSQKRNHKDYSDLHHDFPFFISKCVAKGKIWYLSTNRG